MSHVMLNRSYAPPLPTPLTDDAWMRINHELDCHLEAREADWQHSFIASDGCRSLCDFEVAYAEAIRAACRVARMPFERVWRFEIWSGQYPDALLTCQSPIVAEFTYATPITPADYAQAKQQAGPCLSEAEVRSLATLMASDGRRSICLFEAASAEAVRLAFRKAQIPFQRVWRSHLLMPSASAV
ncbi:MAG: DUF4242 domain-containing protein [Leptolyngbya sp. SIO4C1]|nr:DUF4242 domain-containing protein [Leptolyngbya sp. SIO4C1]